MQLPNEKPLSANWIRLSEKRREINPAILFQIALCCSKPEFRTAAEIRIDFKCGSVYRVAHISIYQPLCREVCKSGNKPKFRKSVWKACPVLSLRARAKQSLSEGIASSLRSSQ
jgi:hypothetical protein